ncbi:hypothetical protein FQZ97_1097460 [compost metagenome]
MEPHRIRNPITNPLPGRAGVFGDQCQPIRTNHNAARRCPEVQRKQRLVRSVGYQPLGITQRPLRVLVGTVRGDGLLCSSQSQLRYR